ncbi:MAG: protoheme IX farnesyltransferase [Bacteroidia bacterium]|nr:MAG: protoheme IX farnesyltransferase [Bacteroidia bacterium]
MNVSNEIIVYSKSKAFLLITKFRLSLLVVFSAVVSYVTIAENPRWDVVLYLSLGGFLITGASNSFNQIIEKRLDALMDRTKERPMPLEILSKREAFFFSLILTVIGLYFLYLCSFLTALIGLISLLLYVLVYTPLKQKSPWAVFIGAFPGALPTLIGAVTGQSQQNAIEFFSTLLFLIQFIWQFPHFWTLAWFNYDDYAKADFYLLPSKKKDKFSAFMIFLYTIFLIVAALMPYFFHFTGILSTIIIGVASFTLLIQVYYFYKMQSDEMSKKLFKTYIIYLPVVQLSIMTRL